MLSVLSCQPMHYFYSIKCPVTWRHLVLHQLLLCHCWYSAYRARGTPGWMEEPWELHHHLKCLVLATIICLPQNPHSPNCILQQKQLWMCQCDAVNAVHTLLVLFTTGNWAMSHAVVVQEPTRRKSCSPVWSDWTRMAIAWHPTYNALLLCTTYYYANKTEVQWKMGTWNDE